EDGELMRSMRFGDIRPIGERWVPHDWSMKPEDKEGHETRIEIQRFVFDADLDNDIFTKRNLRKGTR
ncbi:MAG: outer membrane lipoprotein-sorting protein, partial [Myxococcota bacterium]